jgi:hypothetical protein
MYVTNLTDPPQEFEIPKSWDSKMMKKAWLDDIIAKYLKISVFDEDTVEVVAEEVKSLDQKNEARYQCRAPGCDHDYAFHSGRVRFEYYVI